MYPTVMLHDIKTSCTHHCTETTVWASTASRKYPGKCSKPSGSRPPSFDQGIRSHSGQWHTRLISTSIFQATRIQAWARIRNTWVFPRRGIQSSARNQNTGAVGTAEVSVRKTAGQNVLSGLQGGRWVSDAGEKQKGSVSMDEELSELPEGDVETSVPTSADTEHRPHQGPEDGPGIAQSKDLTIHGSMQPGQDRRDRVGQDSDDGDDNISQAQPSSDREGRESAPEHADRAQQEQDRDDSNPNRNSPTRTGHRDSAARGLVAHKVVARVNKNESERSTPSALTEGQVLMIHQEISNKMSQIQDGLSQMKQRHPVLGASKTQTHPISRPVDLLEVYCEEGSQITQQINRSGGRALRFTKKDVGRGLWAGTHLGCSGVQVVGVVFTI